MAISYVDKIHSFSNLLFPSVYIRCFICADVKGMMELDRMVAQSLQDLDDEEVSDTEDPDLLVIQVLIFKMNANLC